MNTQERYEFVGYAKSLFAQSKWTLDQWEAFADALKGYPADVARAAVKAHFQTTRFTTPTTGVVVNEAKTLRFGEPGRPNDDDGAAIHRRIECERLGLPPEASDVHLIRARITCAWQNFTTHARRNGIPPEFWGRNFCSCSDLCAGMNGLLNAGLTQEQVDQVLEEITDGRVQDGFRDSRRLLQEAFDNRFGTHGKRPPRFSVQAAIADVVQGGLRSSAEADRTELPGDRSDAADAESHGGIRGDAAPDDNDLAPGTYEPIDDTDIPF